jgi:Ca2+-binding RTX toxin-like protein
VVVNVASGATYTLPNLTYTSVSVRVVGDAGNESITGWTGVDSLSGLAGNDTLSGGAGTDSLVDGAVVYAFVRVGADGYLFIDRNADGTVDEAIKLTGVTDMAFGDIVV